ncbi:MAG: hypothetical protein OXC11_00385, partial [Rhodospirillales bacterium]|nr:hypothetical protein [Rhodospirillales bacterium]
MKTIRQRAETSRILEYIQLRLPAATVRVDQANRHLARLIARIEAGEEVVMSRNDAPVVRIVPAENAVEGSL